MKLILSSLGILLFIFSVQSETLLMNCTSKDFKDFAFYRWEHLKKGEPEVYIRSMKGDWVNYCESVKNRLYQTDCNYGDKTVNRVMQPVQKEESNFYVLLFELDFNKKKLVTTHKMFRNSSPPEEMIEEKKKIFYNCREVKI